MKSMKAKLALLAVSIALSSVAHATSTDYQKQIDDLKAGLHDVHMNTLQKYSESWGLEDRANISKLQETKLDKSVFTADQARQDKALADAVTKQAATDSKQTSDLKSYADAKATSAYTTSVAHTDAKVARADADRKAGDDALSARIDSNAASQSERDAGQDEHINAVQDAAQTANDRAGNLEVRADKSEGAIRDVQGAAQTANDRASTLETRADKSETAIRETNEQLNATDNRSQANSRRIDGVEQYNSVQDEWISRVDAGLGAESAARIDGDARTLRSANAYTDSRVEALGRKVNDNSRQISENRKEARGGIASVAAMANIPQVPGQRFTLGAGIGQFKDQTAIAVGGVWNVSPRVVAKTSVGFAADDVTVGAGIGFGF